VWLNQHRLGGIKVRKQLNDFVNNIRTKDVQKYTTRTINFVEGAAIGTVKLLFSLVLVLVVSIYMLLDMERLSAAVEPPLSAADGVPAFAGASRTGARWLRQGPIAAVADHRGERRHRSLSAWFTRPRARNGEVRGRLRRLGRVHGADPLSRSVARRHTAVRLRAVVHPISALWVALLFLVIHQIEGHIVVPNVMGSALRLHPLLVIFGLLAGGEIYGCRGACRSAPAGGVPRDLGVLLRTDRARALAEAAGEPLPVPVDVETARTPDEPPAASSQDPPRAARDSE
jgi:hypothetical protein